MRHTRTIHRPRGILRAGVPAALVGSLAASLAATPAYAGTDAAAAGRGGADLREFQALAPLAVKAGAPASAVRPSAPAAPEVYDVQPGDTVSAIAGRHGLRTADVLALNGLDATSVIYPGQQIRLVGATAAPADAPPTAGSHTIVPGDTVSAIARAHGLSTDALLAANGLDRSSIIYPGQTLVLTADASAHAPAPAPAPVPVAAPAPALGGTYTIVAGDTVSAIAGRHGVSTDALLSANGLDRSSIIYPGQTLSVPLAAAPAAASAPDVPGLDAEQSANARLIVRIGRELGVSDRGIAIALGTAMQESWIRNLDWGDRDSLGLFQQRPSTGWGTPDQVRDPGYAIRVFYGGPADPNGANTRGLLDIPGWEGMAYHDAAQAVQISAYPERYAQWEAPAHAWLAAIG